MFKITISVVNFLSVAAKVDLVNMSHYEILFRSPLPSISVRGKCAAETKKYGQYPYPVAVGCSTVRILSEPA